METRDAWPAQGIKHNTSIDDYTWGYLVHRNGTFVFDDSERPTNAEIWRRWGGYLIKECVTEDQTASDEA